MNEIGLVEAKTKFSEICAQVAHKGKPVVVTRRGKPLVKIEPISRAQAKPSSVWNRRAAYEKRHGCISEDFALPEREKQTWHDPLGN